MTTTTNSLVATAPAEPAGYLTNLGAGNDATNGIKIVDGGADAAAAFSRGDWIEGVVNGLSAGIDVVGAILDPIGTIGSMVAGWLIEHLGPVQHWLDQLLGDPGSIKAASQTWHNISQHLSTISSDYGNASKADFAGQQGLTVSAYGAFSDVQSYVIKQLGTMADGVSAGTTVAGTVVAGVREFISSTLSDLVGQLVKLLMEALMTMGIGSAHALATAAMKCREYIQKIKTFMEDLAKSLDAMSGLLGQISPALENGAKTISKLAKHASQMSETELNLMVSMGKGAGGINEQPPFAPAASA